MGGDVCILCLLESQSGTELVLAVGIFLQWGQLVSFLVGVHVFDDSEIGLLFPEKTAKSLHPLVGGHPFGEIFSGYTWSDAVS